MNRSTVPLSVCMDACRVCIGVGAGVLFHTCTMPLCAKTTVWSSVFLCSSIAMLQSNAWSV